VKTNTLFIEKKLTYPLFISLQTKSYIENIIPVLNFRKKQCQKHKYTPDTRHSSEVVCQSGHHRGTSVTFSALLSDWLLNQIKEYNV
jgi:hypothetical protein